MQGVLLIMNTAQLQKRQDVLDAIGRMSEVPVMSEGTTRLMQLSRQNPDDVRVPEFEEVLQMDPALVFKVLRIANSPFYGLKQEVTTIRQAIMTIGIQDLLKMALVTALTEGLKCKQSCKEINDREFLRHNVAVAAASRAAAAFANTGGLLRAEVGLAGLLHDLGKNLFIRYYTAEYDACIAQAKAEGVPLHEAEERVFGISHDEVGGQLAAEWKLPVFLSKSIGCHHHVEQCPDQFRGLTELVQWADYLAHANGFGQSGQAAYAPVDASGAVSAVPPAVANMDKQLEMYKNQILKSVEVEVALLTEGAQPADGPNAAASVPASPQAAVSTAPAPEEKKGFFARLFKW